MAYKINNILFSNYGIIAGKVNGEGIAIKGIFDMPKRIGDVMHEWAEADSVEAYVDTDEIHLGGRDILFAGVMIGSKSAIETNLNQLRSDIDEFTDVVPLETDYGNACVYVKRIYAKATKTVTTILIHFREPEVGASCALNTPETTYSSAVYSEDADKNDCDSGYHGSTVTFTAAAGMFTSTVSQAAADLLAVNWVQANKQAYANTNGTCIVDPPIYWSAAKSGQLQKNDCLIGFIGSMVTYEVAAGSYNSEVSQAAADALAQADVDATLTQQYANDNGTCMLELLSTFKLISNDTSGEGTDEGLREMVYEVGETIKENSIFKLTVYGITVEYTAALTDTPLIVVTALSNLINTKTTMDWDALDMAPHPGTTFYPPEAFVVGNNRLKIELNYQNQFFGEVDNDV